MTSIHRARAGEVVLQWRVELIDDALLTLELSAGPTVLLRRQLNRWKQRDARTLASDFLEQKRALGYRAAAGARIDGELEVDRIFDLLVEQGQASREGTDVGAIATLSLDVASETAFHPHPCEALVALLSHRAPHRSPPIATLLLASESGGELDFDPYLHLLAAMSSPHLIDLELRHSLWLDPDDDHSSSRSTLGDVSPLLRSHPQLKRLALSVAYVHPLSPSEHRGLETLSITSGCTGAQILPWLLQSRFPALQTLVLDMSAREGFAAGERWPAGLLASASLPAQLSHLRLCNSAHGDVFLAELCAMRAPPELAILELDDCHLTDSGLLTLVQHRARLQGIQQLRILGPEGKAALQAQALEALQGRLSFAASDAATPDDDD